MMLLAQAGRWEFHHADQDFQRNANGLSLPQGPSMTVAKSSLPQFHLDLTPTPALYLAVGLEAGAVMDFMTEAWVKDR